MNVRTAVINNKKHFSVGDIGVEAGIFGYNILAKFRKNNIPYVLQLDTNNKSRKIAFATADAIRASVPLMSGSSHFAKYQSIVERLLAMAPEKVKADRVAEDKKVMQTPRVIMIGTRKVHVVDTTGGAYVVRNDVIDMIGVSRLYGYVKSKDLRVRYDILAEDISSQAAWMAVADLPKYKARFTKLKHTRPLATLIRLLSVDVIEPEAVKPPVASTAPTATSLEVRLRDVVMEVRRQLIADLKSRDISPSIAETVSNVHIKDTVQKALDLPLN